MGKVHGRRLIFLGEKTSEHSPVKPPPHSPFLFQDIKNLIFQVKSGCHAKEDEIREKLNLSPAEFRAILTLEPGAAVPCNVLSKKMFLSVSRGSRVIEKLLKDRLIRETKGLNYNFAAF